MGCMNKSKIPGAKGKTIVRKDKPQFVTEYKQGGDVSIPKMPKGVKLKRYAEGGAIGCEKKGKTKGRFV